MAFQFKISLRGVGYPTIWRKLLVPEHFSFLQFHEVIQAAFGWNGSHLFHFASRPYKSPYISIPNPEFDMLDPVLDAEEIKLTEIFTAPKTKFVYLYDFGDDWCHDIVLEAITDDEITKADCIDGKAACPPDDCGGSRGYASLLQIVRNPKHESYKQMRDWLGLADDEVYNLNFFDLDKTRELVKQCGVSKTISWSDFEKVALTAGTILEVLDFPEARKPAYKLRVDFGVHGIKWSSAQITKHYSKEELIGRQIVGVINFPEKQIGKFMSQFLVTGFADENGDIVLTALERKVPDGSRLM